MPDQSYGSWPSPISAALVSTGGVGLGGVSCRTAADGAHEIWWSELRPSEAGRVVIVRRTDDGDPTDVLPAPFSARTRVHEYGGGASFLGTDALYFSNWDDQRLYRCVIGADGGVGEPEPLTPEPEVAHGWRYADGRETPDGRWIVAVSEDHHPAVVERHGECLNAIVALPTDGGEPLVLSDRTDFVAGPRVSPDGRWISWICWDHPNMPWDGSRLIAAPMWGGEGSASNSLRIGNVKVVAGGERESVVSADWTRDGRLVFATDRTGFWNLNSWRPGDSDGVILTTLGDREIGGPQWVFGLQRWVELSVGDQLVHHDDPAPAVTPSSLAVITTHDAVDQLAVLDPDGTITPVRTDFVGFDAMAAGGTAATGAGGSITAVVHSPTDLPSIVTIRPTADTPSIDVVRPPADLGVDRRWFSRAENVSIVVDGRPSHAFFYPPAGPDLNGPAGELPPLVVMGHGGPTAHSGPDLSLKVQYWTSRGFAVVDVNYGGSSGFGRDYRNLLQDNWGVVDVQDCIAVAKHLADDGKVDPRRIVIRGGSAGGFTVLSALEQSDLFAAGTSLYGVADLGALAADTHKFESRYLDGLIGPWPDTTGVYAERSPINHTDQLSSPLLVLQGSEDEIVPPNQSEAIVAAVAAKGLPHAYLLFEGEQHGFRQAASIIRSLEAELWFYGKALGFEPADELEPIDGAVGFDS